MSMLRNMTGGALVTFAIGIAFLTAIVPQAISDLFAVDTISWGAGTAALWVLIPLAIVGALVLHFAPKDNS